MKGRGKEKKRKRKKRDTGVNIPPMHLVWLLSGPGKEGKI